jgi:hypothetical protein
VTSCRFQRALTAQSLARSVPVRDKEVLELAETHQTTRKLSRTSVSYVTIRDKKRDNRLYTEELFVEKNRKTGFETECERYMEYIVNFLIFFTRSFYLTSGTSRLFIGRQDAVYLKITHVSRLETKALKFNPLAAEFSFKF